MSILRWLGVAAEGEPPEPAQDADAIHAIAQRLQAYEPGHARFLALLAFLLARVANVDLEIGDAESREMERIVAAAGGLPPPEAALVVEIAKGQNRLFGPTQSYLATRELRDAISHEEKVALLHCLFAVSGADDAITAAEEEAVREIARTLLLSNDEYLAARLRWRDKRTVLRGGPGS